LQDQPLDYGASTTLDGKPATSGQRIAIGSHNIAAGTTQDFAGLHCRAEYSISLRASAAGAFPCKACPNLKSSSALDLMSSRLFNPPNKLPVLFVSLLRWLSYYAIRHPRQVLALVVVVTLAAAPGMLRLKLRTDGHALVSQNAPEVIYDKNIRDQFGMEDQTVVLIRSGHADGVFNPATMHLHYTATAPLVVSRA
jgi:hypothetical protein